MAYFGHAISGSAYIRVELGITDEDIINAVRYHTTGRAGMSLLEKIIFLADKVEPNTRDKEYTSKITAELDFDNGLDRALLKCYKSTIKSLVDRDLKICLLTVEIYNKLEEAINSK